MKRVFFYVFVTPFVWVIIVKILESLVHLPTAATGWRAFFLFVSVGLSILITNAIETSK